MPELKPTLATAYLYENGSVIVNTTRLPRGTAHERVPCLILPAPRLIEEAPKTGAILGYVEDDDDWQRCWWVENPNMLQGFGGPDWTNGEERDLTGRMERVYLKWWLPMLPAPQEAQDAR